MLSSPPPSLDIKCRYFGKAGFGVYICHKNIICGIGPVKRNVHIALKLELHVQKINGSGLHLVFCAAIILGLIQPAFYMRS